MDYLIAHYFQFATFSNDVFAQASPPQCVKRFLGLDPWHAQLQHAEVDVNGLKTCQIVDFEPTQIWLIVGTIASNLLRIASVIAVAMIIWGGFKFITSQGNPEGIDNARKTILNASIGLIIAVSAQAIIVIVQGLFS